MGHVVGYSHLTIATVPSEAWDEAWFSIASWRGYLQSFPGLQESRLSARALEQSGDVRVHIATIWEYPEQLEAWRESKWSAASLLTNLSRPAYDVHEETLEDFV